MKKKDKNLAGILALFFGWLGVHRYYLGQNDKGMFYTIGSGIMMWGGRIPLFGILMKFLWIPFILVVCMVDAITLFAMDERVFDEKYNGATNTHEKRHSNRENRRNAREEKREAYRKRTQYQEKPISKKASARHNAFKKSGVEKFNEFDYAGAIADFKKSLEFAPNDIASHFNIACAYSLTEKADLALSHLDRAVALGFKDFDKLKNHHALAYLRIQPAFEDFEANGFKLSQNGPQQDVPSDDLLNSQPDLLDQLKKLGDLRTKGLLTELEFEQQKKKLLG